MVLAQAAWVVVAVVSLGAFVAGVPAHYDHLAHPTAGVRDALAELGLSPGGYAFYNVALDAVFASIFALVAAVIFWRRSDDPMALLVATMLVTWGTLNALFVVSPEAIVGMNPIVDAVLTLLTYTGSITWMLLSLVSVYTNNLLTPLLLRGVISSSPASPDLSGRGYGLSFAGFGGHGVNGGAAPSVFL